MVSELGERGANSLSNFEELAHIKKVQNHLLSAFTDISVKFQLLLQSKIEIIGKRGNLNNREGIETSCARVSANGEDVNDPIQ